MTTFGVSGNEQTGNLLAEAYEALLTLLKDGLSDSEDNPVRKMGLTSDNRDQASLSLVLQMIANMHGVLLDQLANNDVGVLLGIVHGGGYFEGLVKFRMALEFGFMMGLVYGYDRERLVPLMDLANRLQENVMKLRAEQPDDGADDESGSKPMLGTFLKTDKVQ